MSSRDLPSRGGPNLGRSSSPNSLSRSTSPGPTNLDSARSVSISVSERYYGTTNVAGEARVHQGDIVNNNVRQSSIADSVRHLVSGMAGGAVVAVMSSYSSKERSHTSSPSGDTDLWWPMYRLDERTFKKLLCRFFPDENVQVSVSFVYLKGTKRAVYWD